MRRHQIDQNNRWQTLYAQKRTARRKTWTRCNSKNLYKVQNRIQETKCLPVCRPVPCSSQRLSHAAMLHRKRLDLDNKRPDNMCIGPPQTPRIELHITCHMPHRQMHLRLVMPHKSAQSPEVNENLFKSVDVMTYMQ